MPRMVGLWVSRPCPGVPALPHELWVSRSYELWVSRSSPPVFAIPVFAGLRAQSRQCVAHRHSTRTVNPRDRHRPLAARDRHRKTGAIRMRLRAT